MYKNVDNFEVLGSFWRCSKGSKISALVETKLGIEPVQSLTCYVLKPF